MRTPKPNHDISERAGAAIAQPRVQRTLNDIIDQSCQTKRSVFISPATMDAAQIIQSLMAEYESAEQAYQTASELEQSLPDGGEKEAAKLTVTHAVRQMRSLRSRLNSIASPDVLSLALKARMWSMHLHSLWDETDESSDEADALRQLLPDILRLGNVSPAIQFGCDFSAQSILNAIQPGSVRYPASNTVVAPSTQAESDKESLLQRLADEAGELHRVYNVYDDETIDGRTDQIKREAERLRDRARERLDTIALLASGQKAQTPSEAIFQLMLAHEGMVIMDACQENGMQRKIDRHIAMSCMYSVAHYLEKAAGVSRHSYGAGAVMPDRMDPFSQREMPNEVADPFPQKAA